MSVVTINVSVDTLYNADGTITDTERIVTLNGNTINDKLNFHSGVMTIAGSGNIGMGTPPNASFKTYIYTNSLGSSLYVSNAKST